MKRILMVALVPLFLQGAAVSTDPWSADDAALEAYWEAIQPRMSRYSAHEVPAGQTVWDLWSDADWKTRENLVTDQGSIWDVDEEFGHFLLAYMNDYGPDDRTIPTAQRQQLVNGMAILVPSLFGHGTPLPQELLQETLEEIKNVAVNTQPVLNQKLRQRFAPKAPAPKKPTEPESKQSAEDKELAEAIRLSELEAAAEAAHLKNDEAALAKILEETRRITQWDVPKDEKYGANTTIHYLDVLEQKGLDCGFHAAKNVAEIYRWLHGRQTEPEMRQKIKQPTGINLEQLRKCALSPTNITDREVFKLVNEPERGGGYGIPSANFSIISNVIAGKGNLISQNPQPQFNILIDPGLGAAVEKLKNNKGKAHHLFLLADANPAWKTEGGKRVLVSKPAHWIGVVVVRDGLKRDVYVANSLHNRSVHDDRKMVKALLEILDKADPQALKKAGITPAAAGARG